MSDDNTSIGPPPRRPAPRVVAPPKVRTGVTVPPGGGLRPVPPGEEDLAIGAIMPAIVVPPPMPRQRSGGTDPRWPDRPTTQAERLPAPDTFGGQMTTPTSIDAPPGPRRAGDRVGPDGSDTGDAPQLGSSIGTHGGTPRRRPVPAAVLFFVPALVVGLGGSALAWAVQPRAVEPTSAGPTEASPDGRPSAGAIEPALRWVAEVNEVDPARVLPWAERHARLEDLARLPEAAFVDRRLNLAFDLVQAGDAPDPCGAFAATLDAIAQMPDASLQRALSTARAPGGEAPACAGLEQRRAALLASLGTRGLVDPSQTAALVSPFADTPPGAQVEADAPAEADDASEADAPIGADAPDDVDAPIGAAPAEPSGDPVSPSKPAPKSKPRPKPASAPASKPSAPPKPTAKPTAKPPPVGRVDEELRPFGQ